MDIEALNDAIGLVKPATGRLWHLSEIYPGRLYASQGENGEAALFLAGTLQSFGVLPRGQGVAHSENIVVVPEGRTISALRILSDESPSGRRIVAHILYELQRRMTEKSGVSNGELLASIDWLLPMLGDEPHLLSAEKQRGLIGECLLLRRILQECGPLGLPASSALGRWWGAAGAKRDFCAVGIAIEAKATAHTTRRHHIDSLDQLDPQSPNEKGYIFSVGLRSDPTAARKLGRYIDDVEELLCYKDGGVDEAARDEFRTKLSSYGFDYATLPQYDREPGILAPHLPAALFRIEDLDRLRITSFVGGQLPSMVAKVSFDLEITCKALTADEETQLIRSLLLAPTTS